MITPHETAFATTAALCDCGLTGLLFLFVVSAELGEYGIYLAISFFLLSLIIFAIYLVFLVIQNNNVQHFAETNAHGIFDHKEGMVYRTNATVEQCEILEELCVHCHNTFHSEPAWETHQETCKAKQVYEAEMTSVEEDRKWMQHKDDQPPSTLQGNSNVSESTEVISRRKEWLGKLKCTGSEKRAEARMKASGTEKQLRTASEADIPQRVRKKGKMQESLAPSLGVGSNAQASAPPDNTTQVDNGLWIVDVPASHSIVDTKHSTKSNLKEKKEKKGKKWKKDKKEKKEKKEQKEKKENPLSSLSTARSDIGVGAMVHI